MFDETRTATQSIHPKETPPRPGVMVIAHPDPKYLGMVRLPIGSEALLLGRGSDALVPGALDDSRISRRHARITCTQHGLQVEDLDSRNGTMVNGALITQADLSLGDVVGVGPVLLLVKMLRVEHWSRLHPRLVGISAPIQEALARIDRVARRTMTVLVLGEPGVGKELIAQELHQCSGRSGELIAVNCAGLADGVVQSELFGHVRGAFSGAERRRPGLIEQAQRGTLFLDEIGDASPMLQGSLLRLLQQREYRPVGSDRLLKADVRFVAATNRNLEAEVEAGRFRADLLSRLSRFIIPLPPLRERPEDILPLANHFIRRLAGKNLALTQSLAIAMLRQPWPGNVRTLEGTIERLVMEHEGDSAVLALPTWLSTPPTQTTTPPTPAPATSAAAPRRRASVEMTRDTLRDAILRHDGNITALASELGIGRNTLYRWMRRHNLDLEALRKGR